MIVTDEASVSMAFAGLPSSDERSGSEASVNSYFAAPSTGTHFRVGLVGNVIVAPSLGESDRRCHRSRPC